METSKIEEVRERLEEVAAVCERDQWQCAASDIRALLADHARLQAEVARQESAVQAIAQELRTRFVRGCKGPSPTLVAYAERLDRAVQP